MTMMTAGVSQVVVSAGVHTVTSNIAIIFSPSERPAFWLQQAPVAKPEFQSRGHKRIRRVQVHPEGEKKLGKGA